MPYKDRERQLTAQRAHYESNKPDYAAASKAARKRRHDKLNALKTDPCLDCGRAYHPAVMHFHHLDPSTKEATISGEALNRWGWARILEEVAKCVLLCSNCHIMRHVREREDQGG